MFNSLNILDLLEPLTSRETLLKENLELDHSLLVLNNVGEAKKLAEYLAGKLSIASKLKNNYEYSLNNMLSRIGELDTVPELKIYIIQLQNTYNSYFLTPTIEKNVPVSTPLKNTKTYPTPPDINGRYLIWYKSGDTTPRLMVYENKNWMNYTNSKYYEPEYMKGTSLGYRTMQNCLKAGYTLLTTNT